MISPDGTHYNGTWKLDYIEGKGMQMWPDGRKYIGQFKNNKPNGFGIEINQEGYKFEGDWEDGMKHGHGILEDPDGEVTQGYWEHNIKTNIVDDNFNFSVGSKGNSLNSSIVRKSLHSSELLKVAPPT